ncbi:MAG TPA: hypothetical protein PLK31_27260, partial [Chloroflexota bacterium]|nr:hypothetical protein [Chloroflexota bacterium]
MREAIENDALYRDASQPTAVRARDLLARMTLEEKVAQLGSAWVYQLLKDGQFDVPKADGLLAEGIGQITRVAGASSLNPADGAKAA